MPRVALFLVGLAGSKRGCVGHFWYDASDDGPKGSRLSYGVGLKFQGFGVFGEGYRVRGHLQVRTQRQNNIKTVFVHILS